MLGGSIGLPTFSIHYDLNSSDCRFFYHLTLSVDATLFKLNNHMQRVASIRGFKIGFGGLGMKLATAQRASCITFVSTHGWGIITMYLL